MSDFAEIKGLVEKINPPLTELRSEVAALKASAPKAVVTEEKHQRMADVVAAKMEALQAKQAKLGAAMNRPGAGEARGMDGELEQKHRDALKQYITGGSLDDELKETRYGVEIKAMSTDVNPDGGYIVRPELSKNIITRVFET